MAFPAWVEGIKRPLCVGFAAALLTAPVTLFMPNYYMSESRILPVDSGKSAGLGGLASAAAAFGVAVPGGDGADANFVDILQSRWLRERLLNTEFRFNARDWRFGGEREHRETLYAYLKQSNMDRALRVLGPMITVSRDLKTKVISLGAETQSPRLSQSIVQRCTELLEEFVQQKGRTRGGAKAIFAEARLEEARHEMDQAEAAFGRFLDVNRSYGVSSDAAIRLKGMRLESELKLRQQLVSSLALNREQALMEEKNDIPILNVLDVANLPSEKSKPVRSTIVMMIFVLVSSGSWAWFNRGWIKARLLDTNDEPPNSEVTA